MKKILFFLCLTFLSANIHAQIVNIPDANFKNYLLNDPNINTNSDTEIQVSEAQAVTKLEVPSPNISDLTGIEAFTNLTYLDCSINQLSALNVSSNTALKYLDCGANQLSTLNVTNNSSLDTLACGANPLSALNVNSNTNLLALVCDSCSITSLDVSNNTMLTFLSCSSNNLSTLNLTNNTLLSELDCSNNNLASLDISNHHSLVILNCDNNQLSTLNLNNCDSLGLLFCNNNQLTALDVSTNTQLWRLLCENNQFSTLDVSRNTNLTLLWTDYNINLTSVCVNSKQWEYIVNDAGVYWKKDAGCQWSTSNCADSNINCFALYIAVYDTLQNEFTLMVDPITTNKAVSYQWDFGDGTTSTSSSPTHTFTKDSVYTVCMKIYTATGDSCEYCYNIGKDQWGGIYRTAGFTLGVTHPASLTATAVTEIEGIENTFFVSPNPASDAVKVIFDQFVTNTSVKLYALTGQKVFEQHNLNSNTLTIDIASQDPGMYLLEVSQNGIISRTKLIKE